MAWFPHWFQLWSLPCWKIHVRLFSWLSWQFLIGWGTCEPRQIALVQCTLADKAPQDVLRSSSVRYTRTVARKALILAQTCLNSPHTSWQEKIFCPPTKKSVNVQRPLTTIFRNQCDSEVKHDWSWWVQNINTSTNSKWKRDRHHKYSYLSRDSNINWGDQYDILSDITTKIKSNLVLSTELTT